MSTATPEGDSTDAGATRSDALTARQRQLQNRETVTDLRIAEHTKPDHFLLHLSDTHLIPGTDALYGSVDAEGNLRRLAAGFEKSGSRPEAIVFTGDLADKGDLAAYEKLRDIVEPFAASIGAEIIWCMGNHDDRDAFRRGLLDEDGGYSPVDRVHDVNGLRVIVLDSSVPGLHHGEVSRDQLDWLADVLATPAPHGTILAMHHPPIPAVLDLAVTVELRDQQRLAEVLRGSDVRSIIAGHLHYSTAATFAGIPVSVASATCYSQDLAVEFGGTRAQNGATSFNLVHVYDDTIVHSVTPIGAYDQVSFVSAKESADRLAEAGILVPPARNKHVQGTIAGAVTDPVRRLSRTR
ncbi:phosphodiesterase [Herbiconiux sp. L3-i23]|uniref:phosphodiesterase n=1 Tax=Herbiconiux sp. L3-i23 TaxID=2905871 RepID=UPI002058D8E0|nr:phosphodiesterase [Herbiconiux sp. L3-i23]BDI22084.1 3',5'-cyclic adenosine monophosphate phosphodiesterase CpdA [Herbiconiux sp. L3-i23]